MVKETIAISNLLNDSDMTKEMQADAENIFRLISMVRIHHRITRSINFLGSTLKFIAGTPDADDFEKVRNIQDRIADSNNKQILINSELQRQINNIADTLNTVLSQQKKVTENGGHLFELIMQRNRMISMELNNIIYSVMLAKLQVINPILLETAEIENIFSNNNKNNLSLSEVMSVSSIKVMQNEEIIVFVIKYPIVKETCELINIFPVISDNMIPVFETQSVAKCRDSYQPLKNCKAGTTSAFCQSLNDANCVSSLLNNGNARCKKTPAFHIQPLEVIDEGVIILNNQPAKIIEGSGPPVLINGTLGWTLYLRSRAFDWRRP